MTKIDVHFEYSLRDVTKGYNILKKHTFTSAKECRSYLKAVYEQMTPAEQAAAKSDFELTMDMVTKKYKEDSSEELGIKSFSPLVMPFSFENEHECHWIDVVISVPPRVSV